MGSNAESFYVLKDGENGDIHPLQISNMTGSDITMPNAIHLMQEYGHMAEISGTARDQTLWKPWTTTLNARVQALRNQSGRKYPYKREQQ